MPNFQGDLPIDTKDARTPTPKNYGALPENVAARAEKATPSYTLELWPADSVKQWAIDPVFCFRDWLAQQRIAGRRTFRRSSTETYLSIFVAWHKHLQERHLAITEARACDAHSFFEEQHLEPVSRRRYLQLLDKVYRHLQDVGWHGPNPLAMEFAKERLLPAQLPLGLDDAQLYRLTQFLGSQPGWKGMRDRALAALTVGAGLRTNELIVLEHTQLYSDYRIEVIPNSIHRAHTTIVLPDWLPPIAGAISVSWRTWLHSWLNINDKDSTSKWVVPSTSSGKRYSASGVYRRIFGWFEQAQIEVPQAGANVLRNTFARLAIESDRYSLAQIQQYLGHEQLRATERHLAQVTNRAQRRSHTTLSARNDD